MKRFEFRLRKVLEYRELTEAEAKDVFLAARMATMEAEHRLESLRAERMQILSLPYKTLRERQDIEVQLEDVEDRQRHVRVALGVLRDEEQIAMNEWTEKRKDVKVLEKLKEKALTEWQVQANAEEQNALDEWATTRRAA
jgi:flagellar export protein FliJ